MGKDSREPPNSFSERRQDQKLVAKLAVEAKPCGRASGKTSWQSLVAELVEKADGQALWQS